MFGMHIGNSLAHAILTLGFIILAQALVNNTLDRMVHRVLMRHKYESRTEERKREKTLISFFRTLSSAAIWTVGIIIILGEFHVHLATLLTGAGLIGVVIGFGMQSIMRDYFAGITVIMENQYRVGDYVNMTAIGPPVNGIVEDISVRATLLRDQDGGLHIIPNGSAGIITNQTFRFANVNVGMKFDYATDIDNVEKIINELGSQLAKEEAWADRFIEPIKFLRVDDFKDGGITVTALGKVRPGAQFDAASAFRRRLIAAFKKQHVVMK